MVKTIKNLLFLCLALSTACIQAGPTLGNRTNNNSYLQIWGQVFFASIAFSASAFIIHQLTRPNRLLLKAQKEFLEKSKNDLRTTRKEITTTHQESLKEQKAQYLKDKLRIHKEIRENRCGKREIKQLYLQHKLIEKTEKLIRDLDL